MTRIRCLLASALVVSALGWVNPCLVGQILSGPAAPVRQADARHDGAGVGHAHHGRGSADAAAHAHHERGSADAAAHAHHERGSADAAAHAHHGRGSADAAAHAHHGGVAEDPATELRAACPCGCDATPPSATPAGRLGYALTPAPTEARPQIPLRESSASDFEIVEAAPSAFDHVPIPT